MTSAEMRRALVEFLREFRRTVNITGAFSDRGLKSGDIGILAENAMNDPCLVTNPRVPVKRDLEVVYEESL